MLFSGIIAALTSLLIPIIILLLLLPNACYVVEQQHAVIIERLGKFNRIVNAGFHLKVPVIDRKAATVSLRTMKNGFGIDVKTQDNVTIGLEVSAQYHVSYDMGAGPADSGIYKSYYMLQEPVDQMRDFITDALRSSIPVYTLDEVFAKKDDIAKDVNATVSEQMAAYGFTLVSTLITKIALPTEVENSMNDINAAQRKRAAAQELAEAEMLCVGADIYACLHSPCVGGACLERGCVDEAHYLPATLCNKVGIPAERMLDALSELLYRRDFIFKGDGRVFHVGRIDRQQLLRVLASCNSHMAAFHAAYLFSFFSI